MSITFKKEATPADREALLIIYGTDSYYELFRNSYVVRIAYEDGQPVGAVRVISEGVETALLVDLKVTEAAERQGQRARIATALLKDIEQDLIERRVMVYAGRRDLEILEAAGYGRCKNAWTRFRTGMDEGDFLPPGYRFEYEFLAAQEAPAKPAQEAASDREGKKEGTKIIYRDDLGGASWTAVNEVLTKAFFGRPHDVTKTEKAFATSRYTVSAYDREKLVGVARGVGDGEKYDTILNVAVDPDYQGLSIGKTLVLNLLRLAREEIVVVNTHPGAVGFYNRIPQLRRNKYVFEKHITQAETAKGGTPEFRQKMFTPAGYRFPDEYESK